MLRDYSEYAVTTSFVVMTVSTKFVVTVVLLSSVLTVLANVKQMINLMTNLVITFRPMNNTTKFVVLEGGEGALWALKHREVILSS